MRHCRASVTSGMIAPFGEPIELSELIHPRVEPEIAFVLARDVAAPATVSSVLAATEWSAGRSMSSTRATRTSGSPCPTSSPTTRAPARFLRRTPTRWHRATRRSAPARVCTPCGRWRRRDGGRGGGHGASGGVGRVAGKSVGRAGRGAEGRMDSILRRLDRTHPALGGILGHRRVRRAGHHRGVWRVASTTIPCAATTRRGR